MTMRGRTLLATGILALALTGCGGGGGAYCSTLTDDDHVNTAATLYTPLVAGSASKADIQQRLELMDAVKDDVPDDLASDFATWHDYLEKAEPLAGDASQAKALIDLGSSQKIQDAGDRLSHQYTGTCLG